MSEELRIKSEAEAAIKALEEARKTLRAWEFERRVAADRWSNAGANEQARHERQAADIYDRAVNVVLEAELKVRTQVHVTISRPGARAGVVTNNKETKEQRCQERQSS